MHKPASQPDPAGVWDHAVNIATNGIEIAVSLGTGACTAWRLIRQHRRPAPRKVLSETTAATPDDWLAAYRTTRPPRFGLLVGVIDYGTFGGKVSSLPWCDDDARRVARSLEAGGTVVNGDATTGAVAEWFRETLAQARRSPGAVVWFFYSGHGVRSRADQRNLDEWDRQQDALLLDQFRIPRGGSS